KGPTGSADPERAAGKGAARGAEHQGVPRPAPRAEGGGGAPQRRRRPAAGRGRRAGGRRGQGPPAARPGAEGVPTAGVGGAGRGDQGGAGGGGAALMPAIRSLARRRWLTAGGGKFLFLSSV